LAIFYPTAGLYGASQMVETRKSLGLGHVGVPWFCEDQLGVPATQAGVLLYSCPNREPIHLRKIKGEQWD